MTDPIAVFDDFSSFSSRCVELMRDRARTDVLLVAMDVIREDESETVSGIQPSASGRVLVRWVTGSGDPLLALLGGSPPFEPDVPHPVDAVIDAGVAEDAIVVIYAGLIEWESGLALVKRIRQRLPKASLTVMACTCAHERKVETLSSFATELPGVGIVFTPECGGEATMETLAGIFLAAG